MADVFEIPAEAKIAGPVFEIPQEARVAQPNSAFEIPPEASAADHSFQLFNSHTPEELAKNPQFRPLDFYAQYKSGLKPEQVDKLVETYRNILEDGGGRVTVGGALKAGGQGLASFAKGGVKFLTRVPSLFDSGHDSDDASASMSADRQEQEDQRKKDQSEMLAGLETAATSTANLVRTGLRKVFNVGARFGSKHTGLEVPIEMNADIAHPSTFFEPMDYKQRFFDDAAMVEQQGKTVQAKGPVTQAAGLDAETLSKEGITVDPEAIADLSSFEDPVNLLPMGGGFALRSAAGKILAKAGTREALETFVKKVGGTIATVGEKTTAVGEKVGTLKGGVTGAAVSEILGHPLTSGTIAGVAAPTALKAGGKLVTYFGEKIADPKLSLPVLEHGLKTAAGAAEGAAIATPFAAATDMPEDQAAILSGGAMFGAVGHNLGAAKDFATDTAARQAEKMVATLYRSAPDTRPVAEHPAYGADTVLDKAHATEMAVLEKNDPETANVVNRLRGVLEPLNTELYLLPREEMAKKLGLKNDESLPVGAKVQQPDGTFRIYLRQDSGSIPAQFHEVGHILSAVMPDALRADFFDAIKSSYTPEQLAKFKADYDSRLPEGAPKLDENGVLNEMGAELLSGLLRGIPLDGVPAGLRRKTIGLAANFMEALGLYQPDTAVAGEGPTITEGGVKISPSAVSVVEPFVRDTLSGKDITPAAAPEVPVEPAAPITGADLNMPEGANPPPKPKRNQPVVVPETPAEPRESAIDEIRRSNARTIRQIQNLFPKAELSREQARVLRDQAWAEAPAAPAESAPAPAPEPTTVVPASEITPSHGKVLSLLEARSSQAADALKAIQEKIAKGEGLTDEEKQAFDHWTETARQLEAKPAAKPVEAPVFEIPEEAKPAAPAPAPETPEPRNLRGITKQNYKLFEGPGRSADEIGLTETSKSVAENADLTDEQKQAFQNLADNVRRPVQVTYRSAETEGDMSRTTRREEIEAGRDGGPRIEEGVGKVGIPVAFRTTEKGEQVQLFSPDKVLSNARDLVQGAHSAKAGDLVPYQNKDGKLTEAGEAEFHKDLENYLANQDNGFRGDGKRLVRPENPEGFIPGENPDYKPVPIPADKADFINATIALPPPKTNRVQVDRVTKQPVTPLNVKAYRIAKANERPALKPGDISPRNADKQVYEQFGSQAISEFNPLRKKLDEAGVKTRELTEATEWVNVRDILSAEPLPENRLAAAVPLVTSAGFMPRKKSAPKSPFQDSNEIKSKMWLLPDSTLVPLNTSYHEHWLSENRDALNERFGTKIPKDAGTEDRLPALNKGFVRVTYENNSGRLGIEANSKQWSKATRDRLFEFIADNLGKIDNISVSLLDNNGNVQRHDTRQLFTLDESDKLNNLPFISDNETTQFMPSKMASKVEGAPQISEFDKEETLSKALEKPGWAVLTATRESLGAGTHEANVKANSQLAKELDEAGYNYTRVRGSYKGVDQGENFLVTNMTPEEALQWGKSFAQESVLVPDGLLYSDGTINPVDHENTVVGKEAKKQEFYSQIEDGPAFTLGLNFDKREPYLNRGAKSSDLEAQFMPNRRGEEEPEFVKQAAVQTKDGQVFTGGAHFFAYERAVDALGSPEKVGDVTDGFVTNHGNFLTREQAYKLAVKSKQIDEGNYKQVERENFDDNVASNNKLLESVTFNQSREFMPKRKELRSEDLKPVTLPPKFWLDKGGTVLDAEKDHAEFAAKALKGTLTNDDREQFISGFMTKGAVRGQKQDGILFLDGSTRDFSQLPRAQRNAIEDYALRTATPVLYNGQFIEEFGTTQFMPAVERGEVKLPEKADETVLTKDFAAQFMPANAEKVDLKDFVGRKVFVITTDRLGIGLKQVGPTGAKRDVSKLAQGGRGFPYIFRDGGWAFSNLETVNRFMTRVKQVAGEDKSALVAVAVLNPVNHLKSPYGQLAYHDALEAAVDSGAISAKLADRQVKEIFSRVKSSAGLTSDNKKIAGGIRSLADFKKAIDERAVNFTLASTYIDKVAQKELPISADDAKEIGIDREQVANDIADPELSDIDFGSVVALMEIPVDQTPEKNDFHFSYPYTVDGTPVGFLRKFYPVGDLTSDQRIRVKGEVSPQPLLTVMPVLDRLIEDSGTVQFMPSKPRKVPIERRGEAERPKNRVLDVSPKARAVKIQPQPVDRREQSFSN
jgi:hypothetical protein